MRDAQNPTLIAAEVRILCPPDMMNVSFAPEGDMVIKGGERTFAASCLNGSYGPEPVMSSDCVRCKSGFILVQSRLLNFLFWMCRWLPAKAKSLLYNL
jgi:hypothetical protein